MRSDTTVRFRMKLAAVLTLLGSLVLSGVIRVSAQSIPLSPQFPVKGMVTMVDLGANDCIPCKMMAPILKELKQEYDGKAAVIFIDVWKNPTPAKQARIRTIPTQIFYDKDGKEVGRHEGFLDKKTIVAVFEKLGVKR